MIRTAWTIVSVVCAALSMPRAHAQATDCAGKSNPIDRAICSDPGLAGLEADLGRAFRAALARDPHRTGILQQTLKRWTAERYRVCSAGNIRACLERLGRQRLATFDRAYELPETLPGPEAVLACTVVPPNGPGSVLLHVRRPGRFSIRAESRVGIALQIVDVIAGPGKRSGEPGKEDGRLDVLLDTGTYKIRSFGPPARRRSRVTGPAAAPACRSGPSGSDAPRISVVPFHETSETIGFLGDGGGGSDVLRDLGTRSYWIEVPGNGKVRLEAVGRSLHDLRLWRDGTRLVPISPITERIEPWPGRPLTRIRLRGQVEPGTYLVTAYGGPALDWADPAGDQPFHIRNAATVPASGTQVDGVIGPFGSERFAAPPTATWFRLELPEVALAQLAILRDGIVRHRVRIDEDSRDPVAIISLPNAEPARRTIEVSGPAGQQFRLGAIEPRILLRREGVGPHSVSAELLGAGGDEVPATLLFARIDGNGKTEVLASTAPKVSSTTAWRSRFDLHGRTSLFFQVTEPTRIALRKSGPEAVASIEPALGARTIPRAVGAPGLWDMDPGWYRLELAPISENRGMVDLAIGPPSLIETAAPADNPPRTFVSFGRHVFEKGMSYLLVGNLAPRMAVAASMRALPIDLGHGAHVVRQKAGERLELPLRLPRHGAVRASESGGAVIPVRELSSEPADGSGRIARIAVDPSDRDRMIILTLLDMSARPAARPTDRRVGSDSLEPGNPRAFDLAADERRSFSFEVVTHGLYRFETRGNAKAGVTISTAFLPRIESATRVHSEGKESFQTFLRAGRYRVEIAAGSSGRVELAAVPVALGESRLLMPGGSVRAGLAGGKGMVIPFAIPAKGTYRLDLTGLGKHVFTARLEDAEGWPIAPPGPLDTLTREFEPGRYRLVILPEAVDTRVVARLAPVRQAVAREGHGPHPVTFGIRQVHRWREPTAHNAPRSPDRWTFTLHGPANVSATIGDGMVATLFDAGQLRQIARFTHDAGFDGPLEAGTYVIEAAGQERVDGLAYELLVRSQEIQPGVTRRVVLPAKVPFAIAEDRVVTIRTFGRVDLGAVLRNEPGQAVERLDDRVDDWNVALSRPLAAGRYHLHLTAAPGVAGVGTGDSRSVEVLLSLPRTRPVDLPPMPRQLAVSGTGVHRWRIPEYEAGSLILATATSRAEIAIALERKEPDGRWKTVGLARGRGAIVAAPADGDAGRPWRVAAWSVDGAAEPISFSVRSVRQLPQAATGSVVLQPVAAVAGETIGGLDPPAARVALVAIPGATALTLNTAAPDMLQGSAPGRALVAPAGPILTPQTDRLWLVTPPDGPDSIVFAPVEPVPDGLTLTAPPEGTATLGPTPIPEERVRFWLADPVTGTPVVDAGRGMGVASSGSRIAFAAVGMPFRLANPAGDDLVRVRISTREAALLPGTAPAASFSGVLAPGTAQPLRLPPGEKRLALALPAGVVAVAGWLSPEALTVWAGNVDLRRTLDGSWTDLLLANLGESPAHVSMRSAPLRPPR